MIGITNGNEEEKSGGDERGDDERNRLNCLCL